VPVGRLAPRASVTIGRIQAISEGTGLFSNCRKALLSLEDVCSYENSNSHSLTAPLTYQFRDSILPHSPHFTQAQPTYRSQRISPHQNCGACTAPHTPPTSPYLHQPHPNPPTAYSPCSIAAQPTYRSQHVSPHHNYHTCNTPHPAHSTLPTPIPPQPTDRVHVPFTTAEPTYWYQHISSHHTFRSCSTSRTPLTPPYPHPPNHNPLSPAHRTQPPTTTPLGPLLDERRYWGPFVNLSARLQHGRILRGVSRQVGKPAGLGRAC